MKGKFAQFQGSIDGKNWCIISEQIDDEFHIYFAIDIFKYTRWVVDAYCSNPGHNMVVRLNTEDKDES